MHDRDLDLWPVSRVLKQRAARSEDALEQLNVQLLERDAHIAELRSDLENNQAHCDKINQEKAQVHGENTSLKMYVSQADMRWPVLSQGSLAEPGWWESYVAAYPTYTNWLTHCYKLITTIDINRFMSHNWLINLLTQIDWDADIN